MKLSKRTLSLAAAAAANVFFGFSYIFISLALRVTNIWMLLSLRYIVAFAAMNLLWAFGLIKLDFKGKGIGVPLLLGALQVCYAVLETLGVRATSSSYSGAVIALIPLVSVFTAALMLREKPGIKQLFFILAGLAGVVIISLTGSSSGTVTVFGIIMLSLAVVCAAVFTTKARSASAKWSVGERCYILFAVCAAVSTIINVAVNRADTVRLFVAAVSSPIAVVAVLYLGLLSSVASLMCVNYAVGHITVAENTSFANLTTVIAVISGVLIMGDGFSPWWLNTFAILLILAGVTGVNLAYGKLPPANCRR